MKIYKLAEPLTEETQEEKDFEDMFGRNEPETIQRKKDAKMGLFNVVEESEPKQRPITLELYRGFNFLPEDYILDPAKSEQQLLWFTHDHMGSHPISNPIAYAAAHGKYLLTYPLECIKHYKEVRIANGEVREEIPEEILAQARDNENGRFYLGIELPEGWVFTYKNEKSIGCSIPLQIEPSMIQKSEDVVEEEF